MQLRLRASLRSKVAATLGLWLAGTGVFACATKASVSGPSVSDLQTNDELQVIAAVLDQFVHTVHGRPALVEDSTTGHSWRLATLPQYRAQQQERFGVNESLIDRFIRVNQDRLRLVAIPTELQQVQFVSTAERTAALLAAQQNPNNAQTYWALERERFPNTAGLTRVSRAAVSDGVALVLIDHRCGPRCGHISFVQLARVDGRWSVVESLAAMFF